MGPVGAGKSSVLQCLLGELVPQAGSVSVSGRVTYTSQDAWVFSGTLRNNILFGCPYNPGWYQTVVEACALDKVYGLTANVFNTNLCVCVYLMESCLCIM